VRLTNTTNISLPLAVWLASDGYDFVANGRAISATSLLKPVRQILLKERLNEQNRDTPDVADFIASRLGHSIHDGIESAWVQNGKKALKTLGYSDSVIEKVEINPAIIDRNKIQVWLEQRSQRQIKGYTISGKFDMVLEGVLQDFKSTSVYTWMLGSKDEDYSLQGSIYRWLNPERITANYMNIQFIFTDWSRAQAKQAPNRYPQQRVHEHRVKLMSLEETEAWIRNKLNALEAVAELPEPEIPFCSEKDLWKGDDVFKYYGNPAKTDGRATKNFDTLAEANAFMAEKGKGIVITVPGQVKACGYCPAFPICSQKDLYEHG